MSQWSLKVKDFPRKNLFPFPVEQIYYCNDMTVSSSPKTWDRFEVCLRLASEKDQTEDIVDGKYLKMSCPNVIWRLPGSVWGVHHPDVRNVISFSYPPEVLKVMENLGMKVEKIAWSFAMTSELEMLVSKFNRTVHTLYDPGAADTLDWVCFSLMTALKLQENSVLPAQDTESRIRNVSIWFRTHFAEKIDIDKVAAVNGFSHNHFFRTWKKYFDMTPVQYINDLRLEAAARRLKETNIAVSEIVKEVRFAGEYLFYQRFKQKYGTTPAEYRMLENNQDDCILNKIHTDPGLSPEI